MTDAFQAPESDDDQLPIDDLVVLKPTWRTWVPSAFLFVAGALTITAGLQVGAFFTFYLPVVNWIPWLIMGCGFGLVACSIMVGRGRAWAAWGGLVLVVFTTLLAFGWNIFLLVATVFSPVNWFMLMTCVMACVMAPFSLREAAQLTTVRKRLYSDP